ncbi:UPF0488 protein C8orf33 homolog isoform X2 [Syngnathus typhle]|uniref:UPF0488 protein C8orf33 homolog isoform X2 n=1 Tax=Syngnathus typhle TaxID=161592 RepID=UPI002A6A9DBA|nr:UPF0488 protein C8orf33 homolog isoform X2 [Syngnathus typhle]
MLLGVTPVSGPNRNLDICVDIMAAATEGVDRCIQDDSSSTVSEVSSPHEQSSQSKAKKKKKSGKKKTTGLSDAPQETSANEGNQASENTELSSEEQFKRQLDWCIEQLELGMKSQKATSKQKEDASHALKTLRSSKAPLVKKRQVMRAMAGDYRKKMEEEKHKQFKLMQNERTSAQVKVKSESPKKSFFYRRAETKETCAASKEEFRFNFL